MPVTNRMLVAIDGSALSQVAARTAIQIAQSQNLSVRGLYVIDKRLIMRNFANIQAELGLTPATSARHHLVTLFRVQGEIALKWLEAQCQASQVPVTTDEMIGYMPDSVLLEATNGEILVLGRRGHSHAHDPNHLGSQIQAIMHRTKQALLIGGNGWRSIRNLLLIYTGRSDMKSALMWVAQLARALDGEVTILAVQENNDDASARSSKVKAELEQTNLGSYRLLTCTPDFGPALADATAKQQADLIILGREPSQFLPEWLSSSIVKRVLHLTSLPVLIV